MMANRLRPIALEWNESGTLASLVSIKREIYSREGLLYLMLTFRLLELSLNFIEREC